MPSCPPCGLYGRGGTVTRTAVAVVVVIAVIVGTASVLSVLAALAVSAAGALNSVGFAGLEEAANGHAMRGKRLKGEQVGNDL